MDRLVGVLCLAAAAVSVYVSTVPREDGRTILALRVFAGVLLLVAVMATGHAIIGAMRKRKPKPKPVQPPPERIGVDDEGDDTVVAGQNITGDFDTGIKSRGSRKIIFGNIISFERRSKPREEPPETH